MRARSFVVTAVTIAVLAGLSSCRYLDPAFPVVRQNNIVYGDAINEDGVLEDLELDLYLPEGDTNTNRPVVIFAHGGGFVGGDKSAGSAWLNPLVERGYVGASINYRMDEDAGGISYPLSSAEYARIFWAVSDMKAAVRWFRANAETLGIDPGRIAVMGSSAGAVMAITTGLTPDQAGDTGDHTTESSAVCTAVSIMGATEPSLATTDDASAIFFHGDQDTTVPYSLAQQTHSAMQTAGLTSEFVAYVGQGHGISSSERSDIIDQSIDWLWTELVGADEPCT